MSSNRLCTIVLLGLVIYAVSSTYGMEERIECGRRRLKAGHMVYNSTETIVGQWPWHVTIFHVKDNKLEYGCGGSILDQNTVLTAAHCVTGASGVIQRDKLSVQLGRTELKNKEDYMRSHDVQEINVHPKFRQNSIAHDIALLKLASNITFTKYVQPVCIWNLNDKEHSIIGKNGTIVGFRLTKNDTISDHLTNALVSVVDPLQCIESDRGAFGHLLTSEMICAKGQYGVSACNGDSGGGLFFELGEKWFLRGLVSFTPGRENNGLLCDGMKNKVFTDVSKYVGWIREYIDPLVLHDTSEIIVDYNEKLKLFDFDTCGIFHSMACGRYGNLKKRLAYSSDPSCFVMFINQWYAVGAARCFPDDGVGLEVEVHGRLFQIRKVVIHPKFDNATYANDIALIELFDSTNEPLSDINPICLPVTPEMRTKSVDNLYLQYHRGYYYEIPGTYLSNTDCVAKYTFAGSILQTDQFCVEFDKLYLDVSDENGYYLHQKRQRGYKERHFLQGIPFHVDFSSVSGVAVFTDINPYMDWILYNMESNEPTEAVEMQPSQSEQKMGDLKPDEDWFMSFDNRFCGQSKTLPWIGWLHTNRNITIAEMSNDAIATLIHKRFALAAAAIMEDQEQWRFLTFGAVGEYYACRTDECEDFIQELDVREITVHPNFTRSPRRNDIALIEVWPEIYDAHKYIQPICLPWAENIRNSKPLGLSVPIINYFMLTRNQLKQVNSTSCRRRFLLNHYYVEEQDISICTIYADGEKPAVIVPGAPLQADISFDYYRHRQYYLRGLSYDHTESKRTVDESDIKHIRIPQLFTDVNPFLDWIAEEVKRVYDERSRMTSNAASKEEHLKSDQVYLPPIRDTKKRRLLDVKTCEEDIYTYLNRDLNLPWLGLIHRTNEIGRLHKCVVILVSDWYGISTASCAVNYTGDVVFSNMTTVHNFPIQKIIVHPEYRAEDLNNNIAVIQLAKSANFLHPICLPIVDEIRTLGYKRSNLKLFTQWNNFQLKPGYVNRWSCESVGDRYVDSIYCQTFWNESQPKLERHQSPLQLNSTICIKHHRYTSEMGWQVEGSPMFSVHTFYGVDRLFLHGISLKSGTRLSRYTFMYYLEIDDFLDWILTNVNDTLV